MLKGSIPVLVAMLVVWPGAASAQTTATDGVTAGLAYQVLHIPDETFPFGLNLDVTAPLGPVHIAAEIGFARDEQTETGVSGNIKMFNLGGGPRWVGRRTTGMPVVPFVQILLGAVRTDAELTLNGQAFEDSDWAFMIQPGAGVTVPLSAAVGVFAQADYRRAYFTEGENEFRFLFGVRLGRR